MRIPDRGMYLMIGTALAGLLVVLSLDGVLKKRFRTEIRQTRDLAAQQFKQDIEDFFSVRFGALLALRSFYEASENISAREFERFCAGLLRDIPDYRAIAITDKNLFIREIYPGETNVRLKGLSLKEPPDVFEPVKRAVQTRTLTISSAVNLRDVGNGLLAALPIFRGTRLSAVVLGIFDFDEILGLAVKAQTKERFYVRLFDPQDRMIFVGPGEFPEDFSTSEVLLGNTAWKLMFAFKDEDAAGMRLARQVLWLSGVLILVVLVAFLGILQGKNEILQDINGRLKQANARIKEFEAKKQELILRGMTDGVALVDSDLRVTEANPAVARFLARGDNGDLKVGERVHAYLERFELSIPLETIFFAHDPLAFDMTRKPDGMVLAGTAIPLLDQDENRVGTLLTLRNVSAARRVERLKGEFIAQISHKLNTPLTVIEQNLDLLEEGLLGPLNEKQLSQVKTSRKKGRELAALVQRLLDFSALQNKTLAGDLKKETCYVEDLVRDALAQVDKQFQDKEISLQRQVMSGLTVKQADPDRLRGMLVQVLENAAKFNPPKTQVQLTSTLAGGRIMIEVRDNGVGIPAEELPHVFEEFHQVDTEFTGQVQGVGMGLALARGIAKAHGGDLSAESVPGKGSAFKIVLPYN